MASDKTKGKEVDTGVVGTFEDPHKLTFSIKDLAANSVVLYPDQAEITRDIENVQLKPGVNEVTIKDLTGYCQEHSIKLEGKGDAIITDMIVETVNRARSLWNGNQKAVVPTMSDDESESEESENESSDEEDLEEDSDFSEVKKITEEITAIKSEENDAWEILRDTETQLVALERYGATITAEFAAPETMAQFLEMYQESRKRLYDQHKAAEVNIARLEKELSRKWKERAKKSKGPMAAKMKISKEKAKERAKKQEKKREKRIQREIERKFRPVNSFRVKVMVETAAETEASLTLKYLVNNASWHPRYDLRLDSISKSGQIIYRAHFENKTYETWKDAKITFSSSAQTFGGLSEVVPIMTPWTVSLKKGPAKGYGVNNDNTAGLYSIKEQQVLAKKGVNFVNNNNMLPIPQRQQMQMQQQQNILQVQQANVQQQRGGLFGQPQPQPTGFGAFPPPIPPPGFGGSLFGSRVEDGVPAPSGPPPPRGGDEDEKGEGALEGGEDDASTLAPARAAMLIAESSSSESYGMTTTYEIPGFKTIKSGPLTRRQVISTIELPVVTFTSIAVAKLRSAAFLKARFKNISKHTLLRGGAGLTVDAAFLGQTTIPHCPPDDTVSLSLGVDTGVHVSYAKPTLVSSSQGFISKENVTLYKRSIFIHNAKSQPLTLTVLDQVPVSEDERLKVNLFSPKGLREGGEAVKTGAPGSVNLDNKWGTATAVMKNNNGEVTYTVKLEKGRSCKLPLEYEVKLPAGEKIVGLT